jgi:hypothetical protein
MFNVEETFNKENDGVYARSSREAGKLVPRIEWGHYPLWRGVSYDDVTFLWIAARNYQRDILTNVVEPLNQTMFQNRLGIFQQDSAPAHKTKTKQEWLENYVPEFISYEHMPSASSGLNLLDYKLWSVLEVMVFTRRRHILESLRQALVEAVDYFPRCRPAIDAWSNRIRRCIQANGGHVE